jgi:hypothetical protein
MMIDDATHNRIEATCLAVGYVTLIWAQLDTMLDCCNNSLQRDYGGHPDWSELPRKRLNQKLKFARDCLNHIPALAPSKAEGLDILNRIEFISEERHWIIHAASDAVTDSELISMSRTILKGLEEARVEERHTTVKDIQLLADVSLGLSKRLNRFVIHNLMRMTEDKLNELRRELGIAGV